GDDVVARWRAARDAALQALAHPGALDREIDVPNGGLMAAGRFVNVITTDVLVHTWDLAQAVGADAQLDVGLVRRAHDAAIPADGEPVHQSDRFDLYLAAAEKLVGAGKAYYCECTAEEVQARNKAAGGKPGYDGFCRDRGLGPGPGRALRFRSSDDGATTFDD